MGSTCVAGIERPEGLGKDLAAHKILEDLCAARGREVEKSVGVSRKFRGREAPESALRLSSAFIGGGRENISGLRFSRV
jgi:hypothetical protein